MSLRKYFSKRNFRRTPEPKGHTLKSNNNKKLAFVVHEHHASHLHYDFRLELDGVLKSWAVPKGPSLNPHEHHLAIMVEDHPYEYRKFEGIIPEGNYGAGKVIIWDEGFYEPRKQVAGKDNQEILRQELKAGHLTFVMHGKKLKGEFALIRFPKAGDNAWLLIKKGDESASSKDIIKEDRSVVSGKRVNELDDDPPDISKYPKQKKPWMAQPMLCTLVDEPFSKDGWIFEIKWDGFRAIASKKGSKTELYSRNMHDYSTRFAEIDKAVRGLKHDVILDGEIVAVDQDGRAHFEWLFNRGVNPQGSLVYYVFDILWCDGHDLRTMPLINRKQVLKSLFPAQSGTIRVSDYVEAKGKSFFEQSQKLGLEGVVAKNASSPYRENDRGQAWLKIKNHLRQEVVIGGFTEPRGTREFIGSLLIGVYDKNGQLTYIGHSGGGIPDKERQELRRQLDKLEIKSSPFSNEALPNAPAHWVKPKLVCEVQFSEWTSEGSLRQPTFVGMRDDKDPQEIHREIAQPTAKQAGEKASESQLELSHLDKVFFPKHGYTKGDLVKYYRDIAPYILPYLKNRPCSLLRSPNGINGEGFFQKNMEHLPAWVSSADIYSEVNHGDIHWLVANNLNDLLYMVQLGCVEINPWSSRVNRLDKPDWLIIDLDPEGVSFREVVETALVVKQVCDDWQIPCLPKTSGKTGIHIFVPTGAKYTYDQIKDLAHLIVIEVNRRLPKITSLERMPQKRHHKIYLDYLQNRSAQTLAAPYSVRPTPDATVSAPLKWSEVTTKLKPTQFTINNMAERVKKVGDLWQPVLQKGIDLEEILDHIASKRARS